MIQSAAPKFHVHSILIEPSHPLSIREMLIVRLLFGTAQSRHKDDPMRRAESG